jgi:hypothetical protein
MPDETDIPDEFDVRRFFKCAPLEQARDTFRVIEGILEMRGEAKPRRARRSDAGVKRESLPFMLDASHTPENMEKMRQIKGEPTE